MKKTEERLCRQLGAGGLDGETLRRLMERPPAIEELTLLILDISDVTKKYARRMEYLAGVHDGSEKELGWGYWTLNIVGANTKGTKIVPLYGRLFSHAVDGSSRARTRRFERRSGWCRKG